MPLIYWTINTALKSKLDEVIYQLTQEKLKKFVKNMVLKFLYKTIKNFKR